MRRLCRAGRLGSGPRGDFLIFKADLGRPRLAIRSRRRDFGWDRRAAQHLAAVDVRNCQKDDQQNHMRPGPKPSGAIFPGSCDIRNARSARICDSVHCGCSVSTAIDVILAKPVVRRPTRRPEEGGAAPIAMGRCSIPPQRSGCRTRRLVSLPKCGSRPTPRPSWPRGTIAVLDLFVAVELVFSARATRRE